MIKYNFIHTVFVFFILVACGCNSNLQKDRKHSLDIPDDSSLVLTVDMCDTVKKRAWLTSLSEENIRFAYDKPDRFAQVKRQAYVYTQNESKKADVVLLTWIHHSAKINPKSKSYYQYAWPTLAGEKVKNMRFKKNGLQVSCLTEMGKSRGYLIPWRTGERPKSGTFQGDME